MTISRYDSTTSVMTSKMASVIGRIRVNAARPASGSSAIRISSVPYAEEEMPSGESTPSASGLDSRCSLSSELTSGGPSSRSFAAYRKPPPGPLPPGPADTSSFCLVTSLRPSACYVAVHFIPPLSERSVLSSGGASTATLTRDQDPPEAASGEVHIGHYLEHHERDRPQRRTERRHDADRERRGHQHADHRVGQDGRAPDDRAGPPDPAESRRPVPELVPRHARRPDPGPGGGVEHAPPLEQRPGEDKRRGPAGEQAQVHVPGPAGGDQAVAGEQRPRAAADQRYARADCQRGEHDQADHVRAP